MSVDQERDCLIRNNFSPSEMKMSPGTLAERESSGFCSGEELEDPDTDSRSISDVETRDKNIKIEDISPSNKRKHGETFNHHEPVKRICQENKTKSASPFRPWSDTKDPPRNFPTYQEEPLSLVKEKKNTDEEMPLDFRKKVFPFRSKSINTSLNVELVTEPSTRVGLPRAETNIDHFSIINAYRTKLMSPLEQIKSPISIENINRGIESHFKSLTPHSNTLVHSHPALRHTVKLEERKLFHSNGIKLEDDRSSYISEDRSEVRSRNELSLPKINKSSDSSKRRKIEKPKPLYRPVNILSRDLSDSCSSSSSNGFSDVSPVFIKTEDRLNSPCNSMDRLDSISSKSSVTEDSFLNSNYKKRPSTSHQSQSRNYKNMTRERRIEANARERTRVHTISAAFETLRQTVPAYSSNQKLSKLAVLRIACSYIMMLGRIAGYDYSADQSEPTVESCVEEITKTIQMEGKVKKKRREDNDAEDSS